MIGQLNNTDPRHAIDLPENVDYLEAEYSGRLTDAHSYEVSLERMTGGNYVRAEYRYSYSDADTLFFEVIRRLDDPRTKAVIGKEGEFMLGSLPLSYFAHYSYVGDQFGPRAELTEDFLGTGHGVSVEFSAPIQETDAEWFVRLDVVDSTERLLAGVAIKIQ